MVYAVMRRRYQDVLQPAHFADQFRMHEDAPDLRCAVHENDIQGLEPQQCQGNKIDEPVKRLEHRRAETYREIQTFGRVMRHMHCPE